MRFLIIGKAAKSIMKNGDDDHQAADGEIEDQEETSPINSDDIPVLEEEATRQEFVEFMSDKLPAALTAGGGVYITLPGMCRALGLSSQSQIRRIKNSAS